MVFFSDLKSPELSQVVILFLSVKTEAGSAGEQPAKGYADAR